MIDTTSTSRMARWSRGYPNAIRRNLRRRRPIDLDGPAQRAVPAVVARREVRVHVVRGARDLVGETAERRADVGTVLAGPLGDGAEQLGRLLGGGADRLAWVAWVRHVASALSLCSSTNRTCSSPCSTRAPATR